MRMVGLILSIPVFMGVFSASAPMLVQGQAMANPAKVADAKMALRTLYIDHIFWVRSLVISTRLGEKQAVREPESAQSDCVRVSGDSCTAARDVHRCHGEEGLVP